MIKHLFLIILTLQSFKSSSQNVKVVDENQRFLKDCLILGSKGYVSKPDTVKEVYVLNNLEFPIYIHCIGYNSIKVESKDNLTSVIELKSLSDSLEVVSVVQKRISPDESLKRIFNNTTNRKVPPDTLIQKFSYLLLSPDSDTLAWMTGLVSRDVCSKWHDRVEIYYDSIDILYLDSIQSELLSKMWSTPLLDTRSNYFTEMLDEGKSSKRQEILVNLDSIQIVEENYKYFFSGTNTHKGVGGRTHTSSFWFNGMGSSLEDAILLSAKFENPKDYKGVKCITNSELRFDPEIWFYGNMAIELNYEMGDERCSNCQEKLVLFDAKVGVPTNPKRFRTGYFNVWQFNYVASRDSLMQYLRSK